MSIAAAIFMGVAAGFGGFRSWSALWLLPVSVLIGLAFGTLVFVFAATQENDGGFNLLFGSARRR